MREDSSTRCALALALVVIAPACAQTATKRVVSARVGADNRVYVQWSGEPEKAMPQDRDYCDSRSGREIGVPSDVHVAADGTMVGWLSAYLGPSDASYPEPTEVVVMRNGRVLHRFSGPHFAWNWDFADGGRSIILYSDVAHGPPDPFLLLFNTRTGKKTAEWFPGSHTPLPDWGRPFAGELER